MKNNSTQPQLLVIGVDGATFDLILPWAREGKLPVFSKLLDQGVRAPLKSTIPPLTAPAWTSFMTGKNPGRHGLFHFIEPQPDGYGMQYTNAKSRQARTIWTMLSAAQKTVGVINVPMTYPPEKVNGYMISGMDTPDEQSEFMHPPFLKEELQNAIGGIHLDIRHLGYMRTDEIRDLVLNEWEELEAQRTKACLYLMEKYPTDMTMVMFSSVDQVQHHFWHYMDPAHPWFDPEGAKKYRDAILRIYQTIDRQIGRLLDAISEETGVIVMSDHGAGAISQRVLYLNRYLSRVGLLTFKGQGVRGPSPRRFLHAVVGFVDRLLRKHLPPQQKAALAKWLPGLRRKWESYHTAFSDIDWKQTKAFAYEVLSFCPNIWINLKGRWPQGTVEPGREYQETMDELVKKLHELPDPKTGRPVLKQVYRKNEIYTGPYADQAPDLTLSWWDDPGFFLKASVSADADKPVVAYLDELNYGVDWSGTHRLNGILLLRGPVFKQGETLSRADILDMAPTMLHLMGLPVPDDMDGTVLTESLKEGLLTANPIRYSKAAGETDRDLDEANYSDEDAAKVEKRLQDIGYID